MNLNEKVFSIISPLVAPEKWIFSNQNSPREALPYWTIRISSIRPIGKDSYGQGVDENGNQLVFGVREATVQLQRIGEDSYMYCLDLANNLSRITVIDAFSLEKIALYDIGNVIDAPYTLDNSRIESRAVVDLFIRFGTELLDNVGIIETVDVDSSYVTNQEKGFSNPNNDLAEDIIVVL
jgi:hypothetical protein